jgi:hypothetical protein
MFLFYSSKYILGWFSLLLSSSGYILAVLKGVGRRGGGEGGGGRDKGVGNPISWQVVVTK